MTIDDIHNIVDISSNLFTILAICVGGIWTYYNFFYRRTYNDRLDINLSGRQINVEDASFIVIVYAVKNVGLTRFIINKEGCALVVDACSRLSYFGDEPLAYEAIFEHAAAFPILKTHSWIEAGETINDQCIIALPRSNAILWGAKLVVASKSQHEWVGKVVVEKST